MKAAQLRALYINCRRLSTEIPKSFHKRVLPETLISFSSPAGKQLFREALVSGGMESFFPLSEQFITQSEPSYCSLSSLAMVLNALNFDPKKIWKGPWRWVSEETLQCESKAICGHSLERIGRDGMNFTEFESLAKCHGVNIQSFRVNDTLAEDKDGYNKFKEYVRKASKCGLASTFIVANFSRKYLGQTGIGHFSPIGGYHEEKQLTLVMDVARFKYPPYWVPLKELWNSMTVKDDVTGESRGYFVISGAVTCPVVMNGLDITLQSHAHQHVHSSSCSHHSHNLSSNKGSDSHVHSSSCCHAH
jgi:glutathione gamma-glutamylcysteinyltransferase